MKLLRSLASLVTLLLISWFSVGCSEQHQETKAGQLLQGEHKLRKMFQNTEIKNTTSTSFFLFMGDYHSQTQQNLLVKFAWQLSDGTFAISSLPLEKIRVSLDKDVETPTIKFRWGPSDSPDLNYIMNERILYAVIKVKESDWPIDINLPLNKQVALNSSGQ